MGGGGGRGSRTKLKPGEIRIQKDITELDAGTVAQANFPNPNDLMNFNVVITPDSGYWKNYSYKFTIKVPDMYPHDPPKVKCQNKIYHPNIDYDGNVCLNILRSEWKPVLDINAVIYGLILLFYEPNSEDPLNHTAAESLRQNPSKFAQEVDRSIRGYSVDNQSFPPACRAQPKKKKGKR